MTEDSQDAGPRISRWYPTGSAIRLAPFREPIHTALTDEERAAINRQNARRSTGVGVRSHLGKHLRPQRLSSTRLQATARGPSPCRMRTPPPSPLPRRTPGGFVTSPRCPVRRNTSGQRLRRRDTFLFGRGAEIVPARGALQRSRSANAEHALGNRGLSEDEVDRNACRVAQDGPGEGAARGLARTGQGCRHLGSPRWEWPLAVGLSRLLAPVGGPVPSARSVSCGSCGVSRPTGGRLKGRPDGLGGPAPFRRDGS